MQSILLLALAAGLLPLAVGWRALRRSSDGRLLPPLGSVLLCALAFNLIFGWQELWLVIPKALVPGLHPILYHNDHQWRGEAAVAELLQGTGALAIFGAGVLALLLLTALKAGPTWRVLLFWLAFQGLFQSLCQLAIGAMLPGNDVWRALAYLGVSGAGHWLLLATAVVGMAGAGALLARAMPGGVVGRDAASSLMLTGVACVLLSVPFRVPREAVEVVLVPAVVNLWGSGG